MSNFKCAIVWIDHSEAKVLRFSIRDDETEVDIHAHHSLQRLHHRRTGWEAGGNPPEDADFHRSIMSALDNIEDIVVTGPGSAKDTLKAFLDNHRTNGASRVFAVEETVDHADKETLLALGRRYIKGTVPTQPLSTDPAAEHLV